MIAITKKWQNLKVQHTMGMAIGREVTRVVQSQLASNFLSSCHPPVNGSCCHPPMASSKSPKISFNFQAAMFLRRALPGEDAPWIPIFSNSE